MAKVLVYDIVVTKFELRSYCYVHFWTNNFGKGMDLNPEIMS